MSLNYPSRRLLQSGTSSLSSSASSTSTTSSLLAVLALQHPITSSPASRLPITQKRNAWFNFGRRKTTAPSKELTTVDKQIGSGVRNKLARAVKGGGIESASIFSDEIAQAEEKARIAPGSDSGDGAVPGLNRSRDTLAQAVDPDPRSRVRWQRRAVALHVQNATDPFSREPRAARLRRTEKEIRVRSSFMPTSWKKMMYLARQIAGKTVDDALVQMRYSKKKMAKEIAWHLEIARDRAVVERGMGLGNVKVRGEEAAPADGLGSEAQEETKEVQHVKNKKGKWIKVEDPTKLYIAQSWVDKGPWRGMAPLKRARGRIDRILKPSAGISFILKEQKTLLREHKEREEKKYRQGPWVHLPDRPVTAQRQYYSW